MAEANETIADIIAEMRYKKGAICPWQVNGGTCESCPLGHSPHGKDLWKYCSFHKLAHELEAAHKRERGDCAKLREACANIAEYARSAQCHTEDAHVLGYLNQIEGWAKAALAAPARNCDRFASAEEAWDAYDEWVESYRAQGKTEPFNEFGWLFAPATEKEGGAK